MKPLHRAVGALLVCSFALLLLTGCGSFLRLSEERIYREKIDAFFSALEAEFTEAFGMPNAKEHQTLYYELTEADGTAVYLELQTEGREVAVSAHLVGPFEYIRCLFRAPEP